MCPVRSVTYVSGRSFRNRLAAAANVRSCSHRARFPISGVSKPTRRNTAPLASIVSPSITLTAPGSIGLASAGAASKAPTTAVPGPDHRHRASNHPSAPNGHSRPDPSRKRRAGACRIGRPKTRGGTGEEPICDELLPGDDWRRGLESIAGDIVVAVALEHPAIGHLPGGSISGHGRLTDPQMGTVPVCHERVAIV
jgi:hypothetical protein